MPEHGDYDSQQQKWYCRYWMTQEEWLDIHDYAPVMQKAEELPEDDDDEG